MPHALRVALLVYLCLTAPAGALTFGFSGTIKTVTDPDDFLDPSVAPATAVTGSYEVDPTTADTSSPFGVGPAHLTFQLGNYRFDASQGANAIALINDHVVSVTPSVTDDIWRPLAIVIPDLSPASNPSGDFGGYAGLIEFFDFDSAVFDGSETAPIVPVDPGAPWELARLTLNSVDASNNIDGRVQVQVNLTEWATVPEPCSAALLALGLVSLAHRARRRVQVS